MYNLFKPDSPVGLMDFVEAAKECIREIEPEELQRIQESEEEMMLIDVRESSEHEQGHIEGALLIPRGIIEAAADPGYPKHVPELVQGRDRKLVLYCATGGRSAMAAAVLQMMGFEDVLSLVGGFSGWESSGLPVMREARYI